MALMSKFLKQKNDSQGLTFNKTIKTFAVQKCIVAANLKRGDFQTSFKTVF